MTTMARISHAVKLYNVVKSKGKGDKVARDFTTGNPTKQLTLFAMPIVVSMILQNLYTVVDMIVVGQFVGDDALAAVGTTGSMSMLVLMLMQGATMGMSVVVSQFFGAKEEKMVKKAVVTSFYLIIALALIFGALGAVFSRQLLQLIRVPDNILGDATTYLRIIFMGSIATAMYNMVAQISRATGDSVTPMVMLIISSILHIGLDILLVGQFHLSVSGVAYSTIISSLIAAAVCFIQTWRKMPLLHPTRETAKIDANVVKMVFKIGIPSALQSSTLALGQIAVQTIVNGFGSTVIAAYTAATKIEALVSYPPGGFTGAMQVFAGQNVGANNFKRVRRGFKDTFIIILVYSVISATVMAVFGRQLTSLFTSTGGKMLDIGQEYLIMAAIGTVFCGLLQLTKSTLNGAGDAAAGVWVSVLELAGRILGAFILARYVGYIGAFAGGPIGWLIGSIFGSIRYLSGSWTKKRLVVTDMPTDSQETA